MEIKNLPGLTCPICEAELIHKVYFYRHSKEVIAGWVCPNRDDEKHPDEIEIIPGPPK
jgi:hypothetical protein